MTAIRRRPPGSGKAHLLEVSPGTFRVVMRRNPIHRHWWRDLVSPAEREAPGAARRASDRLRARTTPNAPQPSSPTTEETSP